MYETGTLSCTRAPRELLGPDRDTALRNTSRARLSALIAQGASKDRHLRMTSTISGLAPHVQGTGDVHFKLRCCGAHRCERSDRGELA
jgi:hypothetical protein